MRVYTEPIIMAASLFPFAAGLITLPYMLFQYRRYGAILLLRTAILYSFILYMMCAYFLTMLPLPSREVVAGLTTPYLQLEPFKDVVLWVQKSGFVPSDPSTWLKLIVNRDLFVMVANVAMTIPFGIYLRYYFGASLKKTVLLTFLLSLSFELIQLSALFGLYPRPYRLCETDDLITNTLGGLLGYLLAKPLMRHLPSRRRMDEVAYRRGTHVSVTRRVTAAVVDWTLLGFVLVALVLSSRPLRVLLVGSGYGTGLVTFALLYAAAVSLYFIIGEWALKGRTAGKRLTHLKLVDERDHGRPKLWQCAVRYSILYFGFLPLPFMALLLFAFAINGDTTDWLLMGLGALTMLLFLTGLALVAAAVINRSSQLPHGALSRTRNVSTLVLTEDMLYQVGQSMNEDAAEEHGQDSGPLLNG